MFVETLSNAFKIEREKLLTSRTSSEGLYISGVKDNSWLVQESPGLKPDLLEELILFLIKNLTISLNIIF